MKKLLAIALSLIFTLSVAGTALAVNVDSDYHIKGNLDVGYIKLAGYTKSTINSYTYDEGRFYAYLRDLSVDLESKVKLTDDITAMLVSQFKIYHDPDTTLMKYDASPIKNVNVTYNPGFFKLMFDLKGKDYKIGIKDEELLILNVGRRFGKNGGGDTYLNYMGPEQQAKQLTLEVPFPFLDGRFVSMFSLEPTADNDPINLVGGFIETKLGPGKYTLAYQAKMVDPVYPTENQVPSAYFVFASDIKFSRDLRLQLDYCSRDDNGKGYTAYWKPVDMVQSYPGTPFKVKRQLNSVLDIKNYKFKLRLIDTIKDKWDKDGLAYWLDASYYFKPFTAGVVYRNWNNNSEQSTRAISDGYIMEVYGKHDLNPSWRDYLKVFYRTDRSFGALVSISFY